MFLNIQAEIGDMAETLEAIELQFVKLQKQLEIEKKLCDNLEKQLEAIKQNTKYIEENNESKCTLKESLAFRTQCSGKYTSSSETSLKTTSVLVNELNRLVEIQNSVSKRKELTIQIAEYEKKWNNVQESYNCLPIADKVNALKKIRKQSTLEKMMKDKERRDIKRAMITYNHFKEKQTKALIVKVANFSIKSKQKLKNNLSLREKIRYLTKEVENLKIEKSTLIGNRCNILPPSHLFNRPKIVDGNVISTYNILGKICKMNMNQRNPFSPTDVSSLKLPQLMVPIQVSSCTQNGGQTELLGGSRKNSDTQNDIPDITLDDNSETLNRHKNDNFSSSCLNLSTTDKTPAIGGSRNVNIASDKIYLTNSSDSKQRDYETNNPLSVHRESSTNEGKRPRFCMFQPNPTGIPGSIGITGTRKVQHEIARTNTGDKTLPYDDSKSKKNSYIHGLLN